MAEALAVRRRTAFGLNFERHIPERVVLRTELPTPNSTVLLRKEADGIEYRVVKVDGQRVHLTNLSLIHI